MDLDIILSIKHFQLDNTLLKNQMQQKGNLQEAFYQYPLYWIENDDQNPEKEKFDKIGFDYQSLKNLLRKRNLKEKQEDKTNIFGLYGAELEIVDFIKKTFHIENFTIEREVLKNQERGCMILLRKPGLIIVALIIPEILLLNPYEERLEITLFRYLQDICQHIVICISKPLLDKKEWDQPIKHPYQSRIRKPVRFTTSAPRRNQKSHELLREQLKNHIQAAHNQQLIMSSNNTGNFFVVEFLKYTDDDLMNENSRLRETLSQCFIKGLLRKDVKREDLEFEFKKELRNQRLQSSSQINELLNIFLSDREGQHCQITEIINTHFLKDESICKICKTFEKLMDHLILKFQESFLQATSCQSQGNDINFVIAQEKLIKDLYPDIEILLEGFDLEIEISRKTRDQLIQSIQRILNPITNQLQSKLRVLFQESWEKFQKSTKNIHIKDDQFYIKLQKFEFRSTKQEGKQRNYLNFTKDQIPSYTCQSLSLRLQDSKNESENKEKLNMDNFIVKQFFSHIEQDKFYFDIFIIHDQINQVSQIFSGNRQYFQLVRQLHGIQNPVFVYNSTDSYLIGFNKNSKIAVKFELKQDGSCKNSYAIYNLYQQDDQSIISAAHMQYASKIIVINDQGTVKEWPTNTSQFQSIEALKGKKFSLVQTTLHGDFLFLAMNEGIEVYDINYDLVKFIDEGNEIAQIAVGSIKQNSFLFFEEFHDVLLVQKGKSDVVVLSELSKEIKLVKENSSVDKVNGNPIFDIIKGSELKFGGLNLSFSQQMDQSSILYIAESQLQKVTPYFNELNFGRFIILKQFSSINDLQNFSYDFQQIKDIIVSRVPIQLCTLDKNTLIPLRDGFKVPTELERNISVSQRAESIKFSYLDDILEDIQGKVFVVSIMGRQSSGKSYLLNRLFGTRFSVAASRCTDGIWISYTKLDQSHFIIMDCEGLFSERRNTQEETMLLSFLTSICDITILNQDLSFNRQINDLFARLTANIEQLQGSNFFKGELLIALRDIGKDSRGVEEEVENSLQALINRNQRDSGLICRLFSNNIETSYFPNFEQQQDFLNAVKDTRSRILNQATKKKRWNLGKILLNCMKTLLAQLEFNDFQNIDDIQRSEFSQFLQELKNNLLNETWKENKDSNEKIDINGATFYQNQFIFPLKLDEINNQKVSILAPLRQALNLEKFNQAEHNVVLEKLSLCLFTIQINRKSLVMKKYQQKVEEYQGAYREETQIEQEKVQLQQTLDSQFQKYKFCPKQCKICELKCFKFQFHNQTEEDEKIDLTQKQRLIKNKICSSTDGLGLTEECFAQLISDLGTEQLRQDLENQQDEQKRCKENERQWLLMLSVQKSRSKIANQKGKNLDLKSQILNKMVERQKQLQRQEPRNFLLSGLLEDEVNLQKFRQNQEDNLSSLEKLLKDSEDSIPQQENNLANFESKQKILQNQKEQLSTQVQEDLRKQASIKKDIEHCQMTLKEQLTEINTKREQLQDSADCLNEFIQGSTVNIRELNKKIEWTKSEIVKQSQLLKDQKSLFKKFESIERWQVKLQLNSSQLSKLEQHRRQRPKFNELARKLNHEKKKLKEKIDEVEKSLKNDHKSSTFLGIELVRLAENLDLQQTQLKGQENLSQLGTQLESLLRQESDLNLSLKELTKELEVVQGKISEIKQSLFELDQQIIVLYQQSREADSILKKIYSDHLATTSQLRVQSELIHNMESLALLNSFDKASLEFETLITAMESLMVESLNLNIDKPNLESELSEVQVKLNKLKKKIQYTSEKLKNVEDYRSNQRRIEKLDQVLAKSHDCQRDSHQCEIQCQQCKGNKFCKQRAGHDGDLHLCDNNDHFCLNKCSVDACNENCKERLNHNTGDHRCGQRHDCSEKCGICGVKCTVTRNKPHQAHKCEQQRCIKKCYLCANMPDSSVLGEITNCIQKHDHSLETDEKLHLCGKEHNCPDRCVKGICELSYKVVLADWKTEVAAFQYEKSIPQKVIKVCNKKIPPGRLKHEGDHSCSNEAPHICSAQCPECQAYCKQKHGHTGNHDAIKHRNKYQQLFTTQKSNQISKIEIGGRETNLSAKIYKIGDSSDPENCSDSCTRRGRSHVHLVECKGGNECLEKKHQLRAKHSQEEYVGFEQMKFDEVLCFDFWHLHGWEPSTKLETIPLCNAECPICIGDKKEFCCKEAWHSNSLNVKDHEFKCMATHQKQGVDIVFVIDLTLDMMFYIKIATEAIIKIVEKVDKRGNVKFGIVGYRDHPPEADWVTNILQLDCAARALDYLNNPNLLSSGGDFPEAVVDGLYAAANDIQWREQSHRLVFLVGNAPPHGTEYYNGDDVWPNGCPCKITPAKIFQLMKQKEIDFTILALHDSLNQMILNFKKHYQNLQVVKAQNAQDYEMSIIQTACKFIASNELTFGIVPM